MDSISPLAKILAEANGIDWRSIQGSGEGGSVVEQDILNYLSRIMSGDEEPPATPVDEAPAGWTGEMPPMPAAVAASGLQALSAAGVESDITDFVAQQQTGPVTPNAVAAPEPVAALTLTPVESIPAPVVIIAPVPESQDAEPQGHPATGQEDAPEAADADMDFELDDDSLEDDSLEDDLHEDGADAEAPAHVAESFQTGGMHAAPAALPAFEPMQPVTEPVHEPVAAQAQPEEVHGYDSAPYQSPAYDTAPLDEEADFVLADSFPVPAPSHSLANEQGSSHPVAEATPAPQEQEAPAATSGFGLGGFLSRLYGNKAETAPVVPAVVEPEPVEPEPVQPEPLEPEPVQAEAAIGSAHDEHEVVPVQASVPEASQPATDDFELSEPEFSEPVLGEPLIPQAPPIPDTPVAAPLVADQWRDQETATEAELPSYELENDLPALVAAPFEPSTDASTDAQPDAGLPIPGLAEAEANDAEPDVRELHTEQPHDVRHEPEAAVHEAPALPEAHEGGLGSELDSAAVALGTAGLGVAGLAAHAHHEPSQAADAAPEVHTEVASEAPAEPHVEPAVAAQAAPAAHSASNAVTLRLNVDLGVLETARAQLSEALYREVPVTLLVARAAARSLSTLGLSNPGLGTAGGVALSDHAGQPLAADLSGDFRASLSGLSEVSHSTPALLVIDASGLGLDELHRGECSLSVGRTVGEGTALSLRGEVDPARGAQFLHEVAGLLGTPIRLLF